MRNTIYTVGFDPTIVHAYLLGQEVWYKPVNSFHDWVKVAPYSDPSDILRLTNDKFSFKTLDPNPQMEFKYQYRKEIPTGFKKLYSEIEDDILNQIAFEEGEAAAYLQIAFHAYVQGGLDNNDCN